MAAALPMSKPPCNGSPTRATLHWMVQHIGTSTAPCCGAVQKYSSWDNQRNHDVLSVPGYTASDVRSAKPDNHMWNFAWLAHPGLHFFDVLAATETLQAGYAKVSSSHTAAAFSVTAGFAEQMCREPCDADCCCGDVIDSWRHDFDLNALPSSCRKPWPCASRAAP